MADSSKIEWTDTTWNPTTGCDRVSPGCDNCYALTLAKRLKGMGSPKYQTDGAPGTSGPGFGLAIHEDVLTMPLRWRRPRRVFINSMSDLFHEKVPDEFITQVFRVMAAARHHTFQVLTKRHSRMRSLLTSPSFDAPVGAPNVWLGVSVENQQWADIRIPPLLKTPAAVRWLSCEPLLGPVDLRSIPYRGDTDYLLDVLHQRYRGARQAATDGWGGTPFHSGLARLGGISWVVVGGESSSGARPMDPNWAYSLRDQCAEAGVPMFMKQAGEVLAREWKCTDRKGHNPTDWPEPFPREYPNPDMTIQEPADATR